MFRIIGDMIEYDHWQIGSLRSDLPATVRGEVIEALEGYDPISEDVLEELRNERDDAESDADRCRTECDDLQADLDEANERIALLEHLIGEFEK